MTIRTVAQYKHIRVKTADCPHVSLPCLKSVMLRSTSNVAFIAGVSSLAASGAMVVGIVTSGRNVIIIVVVVVVVVVATVVGVEVVVVFGSLDVSVPVA